MDIGGETHFLKSCSPEENTCGGGLSCVCGVCTTECGSDQCKTFPGATCVSHSGPEVCGGATRVERCDVECDRDADCSMVSAFHICREGVCRTEAPTLPPPETTEQSTSSERDAALDTPDAQTSVAPVTSTSGQTVTSGVCTQASVGSNEVLIIGDSFFAQTHQITAYLEELARAHGSLPPGERYRDGSRVVSNALAVGEQRISDQYTSATADGPVQVVIMNGGGADALVAACDPVDASCAPLVDAADQAAALFTQMAADGVGEVIYAFYPDTTDAALTDKLNVLRPMVEQACAAAPLTCHWLDLRDTFDDRADYLSADGALPTASGSEAAALAIWSLMQTNCIAQ